MVGSTGTPAATQSANDAQSSIKRSKRPKIKILESLDDREIETFLFNYRQHRERDDLMKHFLSMEIFKWMNKELIRTGGNMDIDGNVKSILEDQLQKIRDGFEEMAFEQIAEELFWPTSGSIPAKINSFFLQISNLESKLPDLSNPSARKKINEIIFQIVPKEFKLKDYMADQSKYDSFDKLRLVMIQRGWAVPLDASGTKIGRVDSDGKNNEQLDYFQQALAVIESQKADQQKDLDVRLNRIEQAVMDMANRCYYCKEEGHFASDCPKKQRRGNQNQVQPLAQRATYNPPVVQQASGPDWMTMMMMMQMMNRNQPVIQQTNPPFMDMMQQFQQLMTSHREQREKASEYYMKGLDPLQYGFPIDSRLYDLKRTGEAKECSLLAWHPEKKSFIPVQGCLDSGAYASVGSYDLHHIFCHKISPVKGEVRLKLPNGEIIFPYKVGVIDVKAQNDPEDFEIFKNVLIFLVKHPQWNELLIGKPTLKGKKLLPEQNFQGGAKNKK